MNTSRLFSSLKRSNRLRNIISKRSKVYVPYANKQRIKDYQKFYARDGGSSEASPVMFRGPWDHIFMPILTVVGLALGCYSINIVAQLTQGNMETNNDIYRKKKQAAIKAKAKWEAEQKAKAE